MTPTLEFMFFLPNLAGGPGWVTNFTMAMAVRARWAAARFGDTTAAGGATTATVLAELAGMDDASFRAVLDALPPGEDRERAIQALAAVRAAMRANGSDREA